MKKKLLSLVFALTLVFALFTFVACDGGPIGGGGGDGDGDGNPVAVTEITLDKNSMSFDVLDQTKPLNATVEPSNATDKYLTWTTSDPNVANVVALESDTLYANVRSVGYGIATITATAPNGVCVTCTVTVSLPGVSRIEITSSTSIGEGETYQLNPTVVPGNAPDELTYTSSDEDVATVSEDGLITAVAGGTATITVAATNGVSATCTVTVLVPELTFEAYGEGYCLTAVNYSGTLRVLNVPETYNDLPVVAINTTYGIYLNDLTAINVPDSVVEIGSGFIERINNCSYLGVEYDGARYFGNEQNPYRWLWKHIYANSAPTAIHEDTVHIAAEAFRSNFELASITFGDNIETIGAKAFNSCFSLTDVVIGNNVKVIGDHAFDNAPLKNVTIGHGVRKIGIDAFRNMGDETVEKVTIPEFGAWFNIEFGNEYANPLRYNAELYVGTDKVVEVAVPENVTEVKDYAFYGCGSIQTVTVRNDVRVIGASAFAKCSELRTVTVGNNVRTIKNKAFNSVGINDVTIPFVGNGEMEEASTDFHSIFSSYSESGIFNRIKITAGTELATEAFSGTKVVSVELSDTISHIGAGAFENCIYLTDVKLGSGIRTIGGGMFAYCRALREVHIADIAAWCNIDYPLTSNDGPLASVGGFYHNGELVTHLVIPNGVTEIKDMIFNGCRSLMSVYLPGTLRTIGSHAFYGCDKLLIAYVGTGNTSINFEGNALGNGALNMYVRQVHVGAQPDDMSSYLKKTQDNFWFYVDNNYTFLLGYTGTETDLVLPADYNGSAYKIYGSAFYNNDNLTTVTIPAGVDFAVAEKAFDDCSNLTTVTLSAWVDGSLPRFFKTSSLTAINFNGTMEEWSNLSKESGFSSYAGGVGFRINCSDGSVYKNGDQVTE